MIQNVAHHLDYIFLWGFLATCAMAMIQEGTHYFGWSRMSFPFLAGTLFTGNRRRAEVVGFLIYIAGGWLFTFFYGMIFESLGHAGAATGALFGFLQGLLMLLVVMPLMPCFHPRMASSHDGPDAGRRIEPPGFMALNYGAATPVIHMIGQVVFGIVVGMHYPLPG